MPVISAPNVCISVAALACDTPKSRSMSRRVSRVRSTFSSWLMASGMKSSHRGFAGTVQVLSARGRRTVWRGRERVRAGDIGPVTSTRRPTALWPRLAGCASGSTSGPAAAVPDRLEASVPRPAAAGDVQVVVGASGQPGRAAHRPFLAASITASRSPRSQRS